MNGKLCLLCCRNFYPEIRAAVAAEAWADVTVAAYPARCGQPPVQWDELRPLVGNDCTRLVILGRACLHELPAPPTGFPPVRMFRMDECFHLVAGSTMIAEAVAHGAYLVTPGWLKDWRGHLQTLGFDEQSAPPFFQECTRELVFLDTGVDAAAASAFAEFSGTLGLPATRIAVGIDYTRLLLNRLVCEWRLEEERNRFRQREQDQAQQLADNQTAMDFLGRVAGLKGEQETIDAIKELFCMLFAPGELHYIPYEKGVPQCREGMPDGLPKMLDTLDRDWAWTESGTGFILRFRGAETLGAIVADRFAFPEFRARYLNLALSIAGVCRLAIENARTFQRIKDAEEALWKSEHSLKMAQAVAHVGHWEWHVNTEHMQWSDETYRLLGYDPAAHRPSRDLFLEVVHPDDRQKVAEEIGKAQTTGSFNLEYRVVLPDGKVRVVQGMGEVVLLNNGQPPRLVGTISEVPAPQAKEVLGVIQDITDRKELEKKLAQEAHTDPLTGCANRRYFLESSELELARARRYGGEMSMLMLDLDHFKAVNDEHGHHIGDLVLKKLVEVCQAALRENDIIGRLGGEEFAVLLPHTSSDKAVDVAERIRAAVAAAIIPIEGNSTLRVTTSIGVATLEPEDASIETVLGRADQALYDAKHSGRNRVAAAGGVTSQ